METNAKAQPNVTVLAPAGSFEALQAAIDAGADAIYFGVEQLNMRARATNNFTIEHLKEIAKRCKAHNIKTCLTVNTIMYDHDLFLMHTICNEAKAAGIDAIIASDMAVVIYTRKIKIPVHISTQLNVSNIESVKFYAQYADVIVLARELTLKQIETICKQIELQDIKGPSGRRVEIEIFGHGALCVAISGKCYMSLATYNASANRGACLQNCRRAYRVIDEETGDELKIENKYIMSPKDLCTIGFLDKILNAGVHVLKIEGRGKAPEYVYTVTKAYKEAVISCTNGTYTKEKVADWTKQLESVYNRGFWQGGYYLGKQLGEWSGTYGSQAKTEKHYVGKITNYYSEKKIAEVLIESGELCINDEAYIIGPTTGVVQAKITEFRNDQTSLKKAAKGDVITIPIIQKLRKNDKVYIIKETIYSKKSVETKEKNP